MEALLATHRNGRWGAAGGATAEGAWGGGSILEIKKEIKKVIKKEGVGVEEEGQSSERTTPRRGEKSGGWGGAVSLLAMLVQRTSTDI